MALTGDKARKTNLAIRILKFLEGNGEKTSAEVARELDLTGHAVGGIMIMLCNNGCVKRIRGEKRSIPIQWRAIGRPYDWGRIWDLDEE